MPREGEITRVLAEMERRNGDTADIVTRPTLVLVLQICSA